MPKSDVHLLVAQGFRDEYILIVQHKIRGHRHHRGNRLRDGEPDTEQV